VLRRGNVPLVVGIVPRLTQYVFNRSLWLDESFFCAEFYGTLFYGAVSHPLDYDQSAPIGVLLAWQEEGKVTYTNSYWDTDTSGLENSVLGTRKGTGDMTKSSVLSDLGLDTSVWGWNASINNGYPYLLWSVK
jgi:hypothetical protein